MMDTNTTDAGNSKCEHDLSGSFEEKCEELQSAHLLGGALRRNTTDVGIPNASICWLGVRRRNAKNFPSVGCGVGVLKERKLAGIVKHAKRRACAFCLSR